MEQSFVNASMRLFIKKLYTKGINRQSLQEGESLALSDNEIKTVSAIINALAPVKAVGPLPSGC